MAHPVSVPFEMKGGSPLVAEIRIADGRKFELRIVPSLTDVAWDGETMNPTDPTLPLLQFQIQLAPIVKRLP